MRALGDEERHPNDDNADDALVLAVNYGAHTHIRTVQRVTVQNLVKLSVIAPNDHCDYATGAHLGENERKPNPERHGHLGLDIRLGVAGGLRLEALKHVDKAENDDEVAEVVESDAHDNFLLGQLQHQVVKSLYFVLHEEFNAFILLFTLQFALNIRIVKLNRIKVPVDKDEVERCEKYTSMYVHLLV